MRKVQKLQQGDSVGIICPAGPVKESALKEGIIALEAMGLKVKPGRYVRASCGYLAGSDRHRAEDVNEMFRNPSIKAIFCVRGGFGSARILKFLDFNSIRKNPKIFIGYSDITALHLAFEKEAEFVTFHGPMTAGMGRDFPLYNQAYLKRALFCPDPIGEVKNPDTEAPPLMIRPGTARGPIKGGNLSLICSMMGTPYEIDTKGCILFLEEIGEPVYKIDRMFTHLQMAGKLKDVAGLVFGQWKGCGDENMPGVCLNSLLTGIAEREGKPCVANIMIGHDKFNITLPLNCYGLIEGGSFYITEGGVL